MPVIPVEAHLLTVTVGRRRHAPALNNAAVTQAIDYANRIWTARANITFRLVSVGTATMSFGSNLPTVGQGQMGAVIRQFRSTQNCVALVIAQALERPDLCGLAAEQYSVAVVGGAPFALPHAVAHEFGHLLGLHHQDPEARGMQNLMYPFAFFSEGASNLPERLADSQATRANASRLAQYWAHTNAPAN